MTSNPSGAGGDDAFVYMGRGGPVVPTDVVRVRVDPSVVAIPARAFEGRKKLEDVELPEGLRHIGEEAFAYCYELRRIRIPSSVKILSKGAFLTCSLLEVVELCEGVEVIGESAFNSCVNLERIAIPSTVERIGDKAFSKTDSLSSVHLPDDLELGDGAFQLSGLVHFRVPPSVTSVPGDLLFFSGSMFSMEVPENTIEMGFRAFEECSSLRNIAIPPDATLYNDSCTSCTNLKKLFGTESQLIEALKGRFDGLPIHRMLYYQSYHPNALTLDRFKRATNLRYGQRRTLRLKLDPTGKQQDCLGMTPLHILACSSNQNIDLFRLVIESYPENLVTKDRWGAIPILYLLWGNDSCEDMQGCTHWQIIALFFESYRSIHPNYKFDWSEMIKTLGMGNAPTPVIQNCIAAQERFSPEKIINWDSIIDQLAEPTDSADTFDRYTTLERTFWNLYLWSIKKRLRNISVKQFREPFEEEFRSISTNPWCVPDRRTALVELQSKLATCEAEFRQFKETAAILELALWKAKLYQSETNRGQKSRRCRKKMKIGVSGFRKESRVLCGANYVIKNVLPFLLPAEIRRKIEIGDIQETRIQRMLAQIYK
ncbi:hypothetical protein ACHAWF_016981 [Thalassiosira exigua]